MTGESFASYRGCCDSDTKGAVEAQRPPEITAEILFVDPRFSLVNDCYWYSVERCSAKLNRR
jgi:hypothetical protein